MKNVFLIIFFSYFFYHCQDAKKNNYISTHAGNIIIDSTFIKTLDRYIENNVKISKNRFVQVFINYEQGVSRYIFFKTKSTYDLKKQHPDDYFYYKNHIVLLYSGLNYLLKRQSLLPSNFNDFIEKKELFNDMDNHGNFTSNFESGNLPLGTASWELRVYHSFKDSTVLHKGYEGVFIWDGSRVFLDTIATFIKPIIYDDKIEE